MHARVFSSTAKQPHCMSTALQSNLLKWRFSDPFSAYFEELLLVKHILKSLGRKQCLSL